MSEFKFEKGDIVKHKSGDFKMVVMSSNKGDDNSYKCKWCDKTLPPVKNSYFRSDSFFEHELDLISSNI